MSQIQSIQVTFDNGSRITFSPRYNNSEAFDSEFLFNGPDEIGMTMAVNTDQSAKRRAMFVIKGSIATDRITMQS